MSTLEVLPGDTTTHRATVSELPEDIALQHLESIMARRLRARREYEDTLKQKDAAKRETISASLVKHLEMMKKELATLDKAFEKVEVRVNKIRASRLELEGLE
jgi:hypothetical protein